MNTNILITGGMGPYAAASFLCKAYEILKDVDDKNYRSVFLDNSVETPSRTLALMGKGPSPVGSIIQRIQHFEEFEIKKIYMPCNSVHFWHKEVQSAINGEWVSMIDIVNQVIQKKKKKPLLLSGHVPWKSKIYESRVNYLNEELQSLLEFAILGNKKNGNTKLPKDLKNYIKNYKGEILLGCTELHLFEGFEDIDVIDTMYLYANDLAESIQGFF